MRQPTPRSREEIPAVRERRRTFFRLSPAAESKPHCFAVRRGEVKERINPSFFGGGYQTLFKSLQAKQSVRKLGSLIREGAFGVLPAGDSYVESGGIRFLRATELGTDNQIDWQSCLRAPIEFSRYERARLKIGDILVAVKGATIASEKSVCIVSNLDEPTIINGSIFRFQPTDETSCDFLLEVLSSEFVKRQMKGSMILNNAVDYLSRTILNNLLLPLPDKKVQDGLVSEMKAARTRKLQKLKDADTFLAGHDAYLLDQLGLAPPPEDIRKVFAVRLGQLRGKRIDSLAYQPFYAEAHPPKTPTKQLNEIADINRNTAPKPADEKELVPYIGLPECELTEVREVVMRPYSEVRGRSIVKQGDILFARIEPSVFNKKYVLADDLKGQNYAYTSTEFYVVRAKANEVLQEYLYSLFFCSFVFAQVKGKTTGSSGRRRISADLFRLLQIPVPSRELQRTIASEVTHRRTEARRLRAEAAIEWTAAKARFEQKLLGGQ